MGKRPHQSIGRTNARHQRLGLGRQRGNLTVFPRLLHPIAVADEGTFVSDFRQGSLVVKCTRPGPSAPGFAHHFLHIQRADRPQGACTLNGTRKRVFEGQLFQQDTGRSVGEHRRNSPFQDVFGRLAPRRLKPLKAVKLRGSREVHLHVGHVGRQHVGGDGPFLFLGFCPPRIRLKLNHTTWCLGNWLREDHLFFRQFPRLHLHILDFVENHVPSPAQTFR